MGQTNPPVYYLYLSADLFFDLLPKLRWLSRGVWFLLCAWQQQTLLLLVGPFTGSTSGKNMVHVQQNHHLWIVNINTSARLWSCTIKWIWTGTAHHTVKLLISSSQHCLNICINCVFAVLSLVHVNLSKHYIKKCFFIVAFWRSSTSPLQKNTIQYVYLCFSLQFVILRYWFLDIGVMSELIWSISALVSVCSFHKLKES